MTGTDAIDLAMEAGLHYVESGTPGFTRARDGGGFTYASEMGDRVDESIRAWIEQLVIPPAWEQVWVSADRKGHILATGVDKAGRKQYIYHPDWEQVRDAVKFERLGRFGWRIPTLRKLVDADLRSRGMPRARVVALAVAVLDRTLVRVGNPRYARDNESYGLTTLTCDHIEVDGGHVQIEFAGKGGSDRQLVFSDRRLSGLVARCQELAGQTLFSYETQGGDPASVTSTDINEYLTRAMGSHFTAKDFRTWGASTVVLAELAESRPGLEADEAVRGAIDVAAERLGNSRTVCRDSYLHPAVVAAQEDGSLSEVWKRARPGKWIDRPESALRMLLDDEATR